MQLVVSVVKSVPAGVSCLAVPVGTSGPVPKAVGLTRAMLTAAGFDGSIGQTLVVPGTSPLRIVVGVGDPERLTPAALRQAAGSLGRCAARYPSLATSLADLGGVESADAAAAVTEGLMLASYRFGGFKSSSSDVTLADVSLVAGTARRAGIAAGVERGSILAAAAMMARDLANTPPSAMNARDIAARANEIAAECALTVETYNRDQLAAMGCGGMVGVNRASTEPPRLIKLSYRPAKPTGHLALVGKGVTFDSGGLSLKSADGMTHMKLDMSGAAAVMAAMSTLAQRDCAVQVTAWLACTDNMVSGTALKVGDVLTFRNGKTAEVLNTDAEGRLILADALCLAAEEQPDAIIDIATLTGSIEVALGNRFAGLFANDEGLAAQVSAAAEATDEAVWRMPIEPSYRKQLDSHIADFKNVGGPKGGSIIATLFLSEFVGDTPWAHLDMAGVMHADADNGWVSRGATGYGARLLSEVAVNFRASKARRSTT